jgi:hypothetical protein
MRLRVLHERACLPAKEPATMAHATETLDRPHVAAKRYIYAWGAGTAEGNGTMKDLLGG